MADDSEITYKILKHAARSKCSGCLRDVLEGRYSFLEELESSYDISITDRLRLIDSRGKRLDINYFPSRLINPLKSVELYSSKNEELLTYAEVREELRERERILGNLYFLEEKAVPIAFLGIGISMVGVGQALMDGRESFESLLGYCLGSVGFGVTGFSSLGYLASRFRDDLDNLVSNGLERYLELRKLITAAQRADNLINKNIVPWLPMASTGERMVIPSNLEKIAEFYEPIFA